MINCKLIFSVSICLSAVITSGAVADMPQGALAIYCFGSGSAADLSGNSRDGILSGGASISGGRLHLGSSGRLEIPGVSGTFCTGNPWSIYLKQFSGTGDDWVSMVALGSDGKGQSVILYKNQGEYATDIWYDYMLPITSSVNFLDGTARDMFITYDGIWKIYDETNELAIGGHSYTLDSGNVYLGAPPWPNLLSDLPYKSPSVTIEAIAVYDRLLSQAEKQQLMRNICVFGTRIEFESEASADLEQAGFANIGVVLKNAQQGKTYTVDYAATGGTAVNSQDYVLTGGTLTFAPGDTVKTISIQIIEDALDEDHETIELTLSNVTDPEDAALGSLTQHTYTIIDPRPRVQFVEAGSSIAEGVRVAGHLATIRVELSIPSASTVTVEYAVTGGTATSGVDYHLSGGTCVFSAGEVRSEIQVTIIGDKSGEGNETIQLTLSNPSTGCLPGNNKVHTLIIIDSGDLGAVGNASEPVRYIGGEWGHTSHHDGRLRPPVGTQNYEVLHCNRTHPELADNYGWTYNHGPNIAYWNGKLYVHYLSNPVGEHEDAGHTLLCHSVDGKNWSFPVVIFPEYYLAGEDYILMHQRMGFYVAGDGRLLVLGFYGIPTGGNNSPNEGNGIGRVVREVYPDDTFGPIYFIRYNSRFNEGNTDYPLYTASSDTGFVAACAELLSKKLITQQWWEEDRSDDGFYAIDDSAEGFDCKAFCFYHRPGNRVVGLWKKGYAALSSNEGHSWTRPVYCSTLPSVSSKHWGQKTDDGRFALLYNPENRRFPLLLVTGDDGVLFDNMLVVHGELPVRRFDGEAKQLGPQYVRGIIEGNGDPPGDDIWATYSMNKEDIWVSRVPLPVRYSVEESVNDNFDDMTTGGVVTDWNIYCSKMAPVEVVGSSGKYLQFTDTSRYDYARASRVFPETSEEVTIGFKIRAHQIDTEEFGIDVVDRQGKRPVRIVFNKSGKIVANNDIYNVEACSYQADTWYDLTINVDVTKQQYSLRIGKVLTTGLFAESVKSVERIIFRTGEYRLSEPRALTPDNWGDFPNADEPLPLAVFDIDNVVITDPYAFGEGDVNKDGVVNFLDLAIVFLRFIQ